MVMDSLEEKTRAAAVEAAREVATTILETEKAAVREAAALAVAKSSAASAAKYSASAAKPVAEKQKEERKAELDTLLRAKAGTVMALKERFKQPIVTFQEPLQTLNTVMTVSEKTQDTVEPPVQPPAEEVRITIPKESVDDSTIYNDTINSDEQMTVTPINEPTTGDQTTEHTSSVDRDEQ
jgi:hypothetical protein